MVKLKNLKKNERIGECDIFPEDSSNAGHIVVDLESGELKDFSLPDGYEWCVKHAQHAGSKLVELLSEDNIPKEYLMMWV